MRGSCKDVCIRDAASCWHKRTCKILKQLRSGMWVLENSRGYIRLVDFIEVVFEKSEYETHQNPNVFEDVKTYEKLNNYILKDIVGGFYDDVKKPPIESTNKVLIQNHWCAEEGMWHTIDHEPIIRRGTEN